MPQALDPLVALGTGVRAKGERAGGRNDPEAAIVVERVDGGDG
jgi:hypothetical protein